jgi:hypothetical protein
MFSESINRKRIRVSSKFDREDDWIKYQEIERRIEDRYSRKDSETGIGDFSDSGARARFQAMAEDPSGAPLRLIRMGLSLVQKVAKSIVDVFKMPFKGGDSLNDLKRQRENMLEKWGENITKSGRNTREDYEDFYSRAYDNGRKTFGYDFDLDSPDSEEGKVYSSYIRGARRFYDI